MTTTDLEAPARVLGFAGASRAAADGAEADLLLAAVTWAEPHPPESIALAASWPGTEGELALAGEVPPQWPSSASRSSWPRSDVPPTPGGC